MKADKNKVMLKSKPKSKSYKDWREENPGLHLLYVKQGVKHLATVEGCLHKLDDLSNLNMTDIILAMGRERDKLVRDNPAYADTLEILDSIRGIDFFRLEGE